MHPIFHIVHPSTVGDRPRWWLWPDYGKTSDCTIDMDSFLQGGACTSALVRIDKSWLHLEPKDNRVVAAIVFDVPVAWTETEWYGARKAEFKIPDSPYRDVPITLTSAEKQLWLTSFAFYRHSRGGVENAADAACDAVRAFRTVDGLSPENQAMLDAVRR